MAIVDLPPEPAVTPTLEVGAKVTVQEPPAVNLGDSEQVWAFVAADVNEEEVPGLPQAVLSKDEQSPEFLVE